MNHKRTTSKIFHRAREFRKEPTPAEAKLWSYLRRNKVAGIKFRRQHAIGPYIADFCASQRKLIIELDGNPHLSTIEQDTNRTVFLESQGWKVLRFWNQLVMNDIEGVIQSIVDELDLIEANKSSSQVE